MKKQRLEILIEIIRKYQIFNIFDLYDFIDENGESYGLKINLVNEVIESKSSILRLYFDGAYQRSKRGEKK